MKKVLITGANGFVGSHLVDKFLSEGFEVRSLVRKNANLRWIENTKSEIAYGSLDDMNSLLKAVEDIDFVVHSAGVVAAKNYDEYLKANKIGTLNLLEAILKQNIPLEKFTYISSLTAAGPSESVEKAITEDMEMNPITSYGKSKKESEIAIKDYYDKVPITVIRPPAVYGPRDAAIFSVFQSVYMGIGTLIGFDKKNVSLVHVKDLVNGIYLATVNPISTNQTYFISSDEFYNWNQLIDLIKLSFDKKFILKLKLPHSLVLSLGFLTEQMFKLSSKTPVFNYEKGLDFIQSNWICDTSKAHRDLNYKQNITIEQGIKETADWYKANKWL